MCHLTVPRLADYTERIALYFDDAVLELEFPSPWLNHQPTRLTVKRGSKHRLHVEDIRSGYAEAFIEELKGFADGVAQGRALRNSAEEAARDMDLLCGLARFRIASLSLPPTIFSRSREKVADRPHEGVAEQLQIQTQDLRA
jgi:predicted dehydrogenase